MPVKPSSYRYRIVDVFTQVPLEGNALAVFTESDGLDTQTMQRIAREMNLSETVFIRPATAPQCAAEFRIFTPAREMVFAGHPTVGASYVLRDESMVSPSAETFLIQEKIGSIPIRVEPGEPARIWLETPPIYFQQVYDRDFCASLLGLGTGHLLPIAPQLVTAGNPTIFIAVNDKTAVDRAAIDLSAFEQLKRRQNDPFCVFVFAPTGEGAYSRMFAPEYGIIEDPATGSSTGPLAAYMLHHKLLPQTDQPYVSEQGTKMGRRSLLYFRISASGEILVGGYVTPVAQGLLQL